MGKERLDIFNSFDIKIIQKDDIHNKSTSFQMYPVRIAPGKANKEDSMKAVVFFLLVVLAGALSTIQGPVNVQLGLNFTHNPVQTTLVSFALSAAALGVLALILRTPLPDWKHRTTRWWHWMGGIVGACYVCMMIVSVPRIGTAATMAIVLLGQVSFGLALDHFGLMGMAARKVSAQRALGILLVFGGTFLVRSY